VNRITEAAGAESTMEHYVSIGIIAWNEEKAIVPALNSLFEQSLFAELGKRGRNCEVICLANGCTDRTVAVASEIFERVKFEHPSAPRISARVLDLQQRGKINAWNVFVHSASAREARFLFLMDADILIHRRETLWNMLLTLETHAEVNVSVDRPSKHIEFKRGRTLRERLSMSASQLSGAAPAQLCAQLYAIRSRIARNIYLPKDLAACDDGFLKALVCTDFLSHDVWPMRIQTAPNAAHTFEAYTSLAGIFKNQKRQVIGQTIVHVLVDQFLKTLPPLARSKPGETVRELEQRDPGWLKRLIGEHVRRVRFAWRLYPRLLTAPFAHWRRLGWLKRILCLPAAIMRAGVLLISCFAAARYLRAGDTTYWPQAERRGFEPFEPEPNRPAHCAR
jgi:hypothetical protein